MNNTVSKTWRVAVSGMNPSGLYQLERLSLFSGIQLTGAFDSNPQRLRMAEGLRGCPQLQCPQLQRGIPDISADEFDAIFFADDVSVETIANTVNAGKHVVLCRPWQFSSTELSELYNQTRSASGFVSIASVRRWSAEFQAAITATQSGRIGTLHSLAYASCEKCIPCDEPSASMVREFGYHLFEQMLVLANSTIEHVYGKRFADANALTDHGFLAAIDFSNGCTAHIEVNTKSRLGYRTGWMLEGELGSYRSDRLYSETADGEIVDEPIQRSTLAADPFLNELIAIWQGEQSTLPSLADSARVMQLIEAIERSP
jgi:scyllo-inositol 2-dehydrogenase (NADP+)